MRKLGECFSTEIELITFCETFRCPILFASELLRNVELGHRTFLSDGSRFMHNNRIGHLKSTMLRHNIPLCNSNSFIHISSKIMNKFFQKCNSGLAFVRKLKKCRITNVNKSYFHTTCHSLLCTIQSNSSVVPVA